MKFLTTTAMALGLLASAANAQDEEVQGAKECNDGEMVIKFSHVTNTDKHPKGIAASLLQERIKE